MHAASVNPEPGSNSLKNLYLNYPLGYLKSSLELFCLSFFFYFVMSFSKFFNEIPSHFSVLLEISFVVQFSKIKSAALCQGICLSFTAYLLYNNLLKLSTPFLKVFCTFFSFVLLSIFYSPFLAFLCTSSIKVPS